VIETLDANLFHGSTPPLKLIEAAKRSAEDKRVFLSKHLLNVGYMSTCIIPCDSLPTRKGGKLYG
jgi:hypothetical protein